MSAGRQDDGVRRERAPYPGVVHGPSGPLRLPPAAAGPSVTEGDGPGARWWREAAVTATTFAVFVLGGVVQADGTLSPPAAAVYLMAAASCGVLPARRRAPLAVLLATVAFGVLVQPFGLPLNPLVAAPVAVAAYCYALTTSAEARAAGAALLASAALLVASSPSWDELSWQDAGRIGAVAAVPLVASVLGSSVRNRRAYLAAMEERARRAEDSRDHEARRRVAEERIRIARELHDLVAHQITLANAQATVAAHLFNARPEQTLASLRQVVETTRQALDDLRATVGLLRQSGDPAAPAEPTPGLAQLPALLESFRRAGLRVSVHRDGTARALAPGVDLSAYRIVQEALTNVTKHAGTASADVRLAWHQDHVTITIADDGGRRTHTAPDRPPGYGLIGMRERATAVGGSLTAGRSPEGGFRVCAHLPLQPGGAPGDGADGGTR